MIRPFPPSRRLVTAAVRAGRRIMPMHGLFDVDISTAKHRLGEHDPPLSFTAFVIATLARAAALHPEVHAYRDWRGRLVQHRHVDVQTLVEVPTAGGEEFGLVHVVRDADIRSVADISDEIRVVSTDATSTRSGRLLQTLAPSLGRIPGLYRAMYAAISRSRRVHLASGTVQVTAVGMFADGAGYAIAPATLASLSWSSGASAAVHAPSATTSKYETSWTSPSPSTTTSSTAVPPPASPPTSAACCTPRLYSLASRPILLTFPILIDGGKRMFSDTDTLTRFELVQCAVSDSGVTINSYRRTAPACLSRNRAT